MMRTEDRWGAHNYRPLDVCEAGILVPPPIISEEDLAWAAGQVRKTFEG
ncbi:MAG: hypothetical protein ABSG26_03215 [Bryobacteraceae bacterium]